MGDSTIRQFTPEQLQHPLTLEGAGYEFAVNVDLNGVKHGQLTMMHVRSGLHEHWPGGLLGHLTNFEDDGAHTLVIWSNEADEREYFNSTAVEMLTDSVPALIEAQPEDPLGDFEITHSQVHRLLLTTECWAFADIGADPDHNSVEALGTEPHLTRIKYPDVSTGDYDAAGAALAYEQGLPDGMLLQLVEASAGSLIDTQLWRSAELARAHLGSSYEQAMASLLPGEEAPRIERMSRISFGAKELARIFGDRD